MLMCCALQEGVYRHVNGRLITHAEEIAFYGGNAKEKGIITSAFHDLVALVRRSQQVRVAIIMCAHAVANRVLIKH
jgi:ATP-binding cassette, subfamily D (ALD), member 3